MGPQANACTMAAISTIGASDRGRAPANLYDLFIHAYLSAAIVCYGNRSIPCKCSSDAANASRGNCISLEDAGQRRRQRHRELSGRRRLWMTWGRLRSEPSACLGEIEQAAQGLVDRLRVRECLSYLRV